jgi:hypothetical protein
MSQMKALRGYAPPPSFSSALEELQTWSWRKVCVCGGGGGSGLPHFSGHPHSSPWLRPCKQT